MHWSCKNKYGGPFTTEEVEDTKTFFSILLLLLSLLGFHLSGHGYSVGEQLMHKQCPSYWVLLLAADPNYSFLLITVIGVPTNMLITKYCSNYSPNMLKRMGMGLFLCVVKESVVIIIQVMMTQGEYCNHLDNTTIDSCYFLTSEITINNTCLAVSNFTNNFFHCYQNNTVNTQHTLWSVLSTGVHDCAWVHLCSGSPSTERTTNRHLVGY